MIFETKIENDIKNAKQNFNNNSAKCNTKSNNYK